MPGAPERGSRLQRLRQPLGFGAREVPGVPDDGVELGVSAAVGRLLDAEALGVVKCLDGPREEVLRPTDDALDDVKEGVVAWGLTLLAVSHWGPPRREHWRCSPTRRRGTQGARRS